MKKIENSKGYAELKPLYSICQPYGHFMFFNSVSPVTSSQSFNYGSRPSPQRGHSLPARPGRRHLPRLQILPLPQPQHALPRQPRMLPQNVRVLRRPHFQHGPCPLSCRRLRSHPPQTTISATDLRRSADRERGRCEAEGSCHV